MTVARELFLEYVRGVLGREPSPVFMRMFEGALAESATNERGACAGIADSWGDDLIADEIRARGNR